jgi:hypothetical protein
MYYFCECCKRFCYTFEDLQKSAGEGEYLDDHVTSEDVARKISEGALLANLMLDGHSFEMAERIVNQDHVKRREK